MYDCVLSETLSNIGAEDDRILIGVNRYPRTYEGPTAHSNKDFYLINDMGCVYCATNQINGKQYIGKTMHKLSCRKKQHIKSAKNNSKLAFHEALRKYGLKNFVWEKIFEDNDNGLLLSAETHYIKKYNTISPHGYNLTYGGEGISFSEETIKKIRGLTKKQWSNNKTRNRLIKNITIAMNRPEVKAKRKYIRARKTICLETGKIFKSMKDAAIKMSVNYQCVYLVCKGKLESTGGYHFEYYYGEQK
jgi:group I intron endonuclease